MVNAAVHVVGRGTIRADPNFAIEGHTTASVGNPSPDAGDKYWPSALYAEFGHYDAAERDLGTALGGSATRSTTSST